MPALHRDRAIPLTAEHAEALDRILAITRAAWAVDSAPGNGEGEGNGPRQAARPQAPAKTSRRAQLAQLAARAFAAQVMALRCRQAFVA